MLKHTLSALCLVISFSLSAQQSESLQITLSPDQYSDIQKHFVEKEKIKHRNKDWANFQRYADANLTVNKSVKAVFMGNSITDNWAKQHPSFFTDNNFVGRGISGQTTHQMLVRFRADVINLNPKVVVILAGTNDIARNNGYISHEHILQNIQSMCELALYHKIKPILCSILPAYQYRWNKTIDAVPEIKAMNELLKAYADKNKIPYVDYYTLLVDERGGLPADLAPDGVHPNLKAYEMMELEVLKVIRKVSKR